VTQVDTTAAIIPNPPATITDPGGMSLVNGPDSDVTIMVNGIFGDPNGWQKRQAERLTASGKGTGLTYFYWCGLFMEFQEQHAQELAKLIQQTIAANPGKKVNIISHSNGANLEERALEISGASVNIVAKLAAATYKSCAGKSDDNNWHNGCDGLLSRGQVQRIYVFVSRNDGILGSPLQWPAWWNGRTLGLDGPIDTNYYPYKTGDEVKFADLPTTDLGDKRMIVVRDDSQSHLTWTSSDDVFDVLFDLPSAPPSGAP
jgi:hypothetical protein